MNEINDINEKVFLRSELFEREACVACLQFRPQFQYQRHDVYQIPLFVYHCSLFIPLRGLRNKTININSHKN